MMWLRYKFLVLPLLLSLISPWALAEVMRIDHAVVRQMPPGVPNTAIYMRLNNDGAESVTLIGAQASWAERVELHAHVHADGVVGMRPIDAVTVEQQGQVEFKPGGRHVMVFGLEQPLQAEQHLPLTLLFDDGRRQTVQVIVKKDVQAFLGQATNDDTTGTTTGTTPQDVTHDHSHH